MIPKLRNLSRTGELGLCAGGALIPISYIITLIEIAVPIGSPASGLLENLPNSEAAWACSLRQSARPTKSSGSVSIA